MSVLRHAVAPTASLQPMRHVQCGRRLCTLPRALGQHARDAGQPLRLQHRVRACSHDHASHEHASTSSEDRATYTVTTPLYYVNAAPHMGSAYPTIAADVIARFQRLQGKRVTFITGTDEHGEKIAAAAAARGMEPRQHCNDIVASYKQLWHELGIGYDSFVRTTEPEHEAVVRQVLEAAWDKGDVYAADYEGWYCVDCEEYKDEADMDADRNCPVHRRACTLRAEQNYFFALSKYQQQLEDLLADPSFVRPAARRNEVLGWVKGGVRDFSISRAAVTWGIPVPRDPRQTVYVWFDALNGYLSGLLRGAAPATPEALAAAGWPADLHIIGKDILRFHAVYWPAMLMSAGLPPPRTVFGHGFLTKDGLKMGKSLGNVVDPLALVHAYGADAVRYFLMRETHFGQDGDFSEERFRAVVNSALANDVGNLLNRTLTLLRANCGGALPVAAADTPADNPIRALAEVAAPAAAGAYAALRFDEACLVALGVSSRGNQFLEEQAPWTAFKKGDDADKARAAAALVAVLEGLRVAAVLLSPVTPSLSAAIYSQLGLPAEAFEALSWRDTAWGGLPAGHPTADPVPVFTRLDGDWVTEPAGGRDAADGKAAGKGGKDGKQQKGKAKPKAQAVAAAEAGAAA